MVIPTMQGESAMRMQDAMAAMGAGRVVDISALVDRAPAHEGGGSPSKAARPAAKSEPAVTLG